jgi:23S rRNA (uridine2552-2'-O)-methyltransferase
VKRAKSAWMREHVNDTFVKRAQAQGMRSRAAFKLEEIARTDKLLRPGMVVVDLGAAPGSWSQVAAQAVGPAGRVVAIDLLEMKPLAGVHFLQADMRSKESRTALGQALAGRQADLVLCDMAPNLSGVASTDQARHRELGELALRFSAEHLKPGGAFLIKAFQGSDYREFMETMKKCFSSVASRKPAASRDRSPEMYLLGKGFKRPCVDLSGPDDT